MLNFVLRLTLLAVLGFTFGFISGAISRQEEINQATKRIEIAEKPDTLKVGAATKVFKVLIPSPLGMGGGTAFLVSTPKGNVVLTNRHICDAVERGMMGAYLEQYPSTRYFTAVKKRAKNTDLCVLQAPEFLKEADAYKVATKPAGRYESVYVYGHPFLEPLTENHGVFLHELRFPKDETNEYFANVLAARLNFFIRPGNSGSPVLNFDGEIVGVVFGLDDMGGLFIPLSSIKEFLGV